jgi:hypothetical protein
LEQNRARITAQGLGIAAISYDSIPVLESFAQRQQIGFELLSDPDSKVIRSYGILNETVAANSPQFGIPYPGTYVLDANGVVKEKYFADDYRVRDTAESILLRQFGLTASPSEAQQAKHLKLAPTGVATPVRPNQRVSLALRIDLPPRTHVYAPGVMGYIPISLTLIPSAAFQADPAKYPASKTLRLEVIHETVPVFEGSFSIVQTITLAAPKQIEPLLDSERGLPIEADFRYQACDDRECYVPETLHVKWNVHVLPFDLTRAPEELRKK